jgi:hypothetical protein
MILCASCLHEVPDDYLRCPFCSEELVAPEPAASDTGDPAEESGEKIEWAIVRTVSTEIEARLLAGRLEANGIPACVLSQVDRTRNFTVGDLAVAKLFVPAPLLDEARALLDSPAEYPDEASQ